MFHTLRYCADPPKSSKESLFTVTVGNQVSEAEFVLRDPTEVFETINMFNDCDRERDLEGQGLPHQDGT